MNRRDFLRRAALIASGAAAFDQLEILERLNHSKVFALGGMPTYPEWTNSATSARFTIDSLRVWRCQMLEQALRPLEYDFPLVSTRMEGKQLRYLRDGGFSIAEQL